MNIRGWCPSLSAPMESGDGWLLRVRPRHATLTAANSRRIAVAAAEHGNGIIELTQRGNLQIRGLSPASAATFADRMVAAGLGDFGPNLLVSPLAGEDPDVDPKPSPSPMRSVPPGLANCRTNSYSWWMAEAQPG